MWQEVGDGVFGIAQPLTMSYVTAGLDGEAEVRRSFSMPLGESIIGGESIETIVDFYGVEMLSIATQHFGGSHGMGIERTAPVRVVPARGPDVHRLHIANYERPAWWCGRPVLKKPPHEPEGL